MSDRKIINKYFPIDFDPAKLPRRKKVKNNQTKVRMALPMSIRCTRCSNFMARNTKFNARKETIVGKTYLNIQAYRLYFRCSRCFAEITIRTEPEVSDYACEKGATRSYELHKEEAAKEEAFKLEQDELLGVGDTMKILEDKSAKSKMEIEVSEAIDAVFYLQSKRQNISPESLALAASRRSGEESLNEEGLSKEDLEEVERFRSARAENPASGERQYIKRLKDDEESPLEARNRLALENMSKKKRVQVEEESKPSPRPSPIMQSGLVSVQLKPKEAKVGLVSSYPRVEDNED